MLSDSSQAAQLGGDPSLPIPAAAAQGATFTIRWRTGRKGDGSPTVVTALRAGQGSSPGVDLADRNVEPGSNVLHGFIALRNDAHSLSDGLGRDGVIAGDHDDLQELFFRDGPVSPVGHQPCLPALAQASP